MTVTLVIPMARGDVLLASLRLKIFTGRLYEEREGSDSKLNHLNFFHKQCEKSTRYQPFSGDRIIERGWTPRSRAAILPDDCRAALPSEFKAAAGVTKLSGDFFFFWAVALTLCSPVSSPY